MINFTICLPAMKHPDEWTISKLRPYKCLHKDSLLFETQGGVGPPYFLQSLVFRNHFEELETVLLVVELIINNAPLTYFYPNTIETCLTLNHLLFGRQLLYSSNTKSTVVTNLTVFSSTTDKINYIGNHFWDRWRHEYMVNLRETQRTSKLNMKR